jgi:predicted nucleic acid-binding protein
MTKANRFFIDSNIWVYALSEQGDRREVFARDFIKSVCNVSVPVVSYQVVNEILQVLRRFEKHERALRQIVERMFDTCEVAGFTKEAALLASELRETMSVSYWDSQIVASALLAGCDVLISEDLQDGAVIRKKLKVKNIFKDER